MNLFYRLFVSVVLLSTGLPAASRRALVIGNDSYPQHELKNAIADATAVGEALGKMGYEVTLQLDATSTTMDNSLLIFGSKIVPGDIVLIYYSGHGMQIDGENYLVPIDFKINSPLSAKSQALSLSHIIEEVTSRGASAEVVILDACRNNPFSSTRSLGDEGSAGVTIGWAKTITPEGTYLAFGTAPGSTASDNPSQPHGLFTEYLLKYLGSAQLDIEGVFQAVRADVIQASAGQQVPWVASSLIGDLHINPALDSRVSTRTLRQRYPVTPAGADVPSRGLPNGARASVELKDPSSDNESAQILASQGLLLARAQNYTEAIKSLSAALAINPEYALALRLLGLIFHLLGRNREAIVELDRAISIEPTDSTSHYYKCLATTSSEPTVAVQECQTAIGIDHQSAAAHWGLAYAFLVLAKTEKALTEANTAVMLSPNVSLGYSLRGKIFLALGKYAAAREDFDTAIRLTVVQ